MLLIGAHQQGGGKTVIPIGSSIGSSLLQPDGIAVGAAPFDVVCHPADKIPEAVFILFDQSKVYLFGIAAQAVPAGAVFGIGVDGGIIPESHRFDPLSAQALDAVDRTGGTADVHQCFHRSVLPL